MERPGFNESTQKLLESDGGLMCSSCCSLPYPELVKYYYNSDSNTYHLVWRRCDYKTPNTIYSYPASIKEFRGDFILGGKYSMPMTSNRLVRWETDGVTIPLEDYDYYQTGGSHFNGHFETGYSGNYIYAHEGTYLFTAFNSYLTDPENIVWTYNFYDEHGVEPFFRGIVEYGDHIFSATRSDPWYIIKLDREDGEEIDYVDDHPYDGGHILLENEGYLYLIDGYPESYQYIHMIDPDDLSIVHSWWNGIWHDRYIFDAAWYGGYLYLATSRYEGATVKKIDLEYGVGVEEVWSYDTGGAAYGFYISGSTIYVGHRRNNNIDSTYRSVTVLDDDGDFITGVDTGKAALDVLSSSEGDRNYLYAIYDINDLDNDWTSWY